MLGLEVEHLPIVIRRRNETPALFWNSRRIITLGES
jgi:hypothetical protein